MIGRKCQIWFFANLSQRPRWPFLIKIGPLSDVVIVFMSLSLQTFLHFGLFLQNHCANPNQTWQNAAMVWRVLQFVKLNVDLKSLIFFIYLFIYFLWLWVGWGHNSGLKYFILINRGKSKKFYFKKTFSQKSLSVSILRWCRSMLIQITIPRNRAGLQLECWSFA